MSAVHSKMGAGNSSPEAWEMALETEPSRLSKVAPPKISRKITIIMAIMATRPFSTPYL